MHFITTVCRICSAKYGGESDECRRFFDKCEACGAVGEVSFTFEVRWKKEEKIYAFHPKGRTRAIKKTR